MDTLTNPVYLGLSLVLGAISFVLLTAGLRARNLPMALWGVAIGAPSYAPGEPVFWMLGVIFGVFAYQAGRL